MTGNSWMVVKNGAQLEGKFTDHDVQAMLQNATPGSVLVWKEGMSQWADPTTLSEFKTPLPGDETQPRMSGAGAGQNTMPGGTPPQPKGEAGEKFKEGGKAILEGAAVQFGKIRDAKDSHSYLPHLKVLDWCIGLARKMLSKDLLDNVDELGKKVGNVALIVAALFFFIGMVIVGIKNKDFLATPGMGLVYVLAFCLAQYVAIKFLDAGKTLIEKSPSRLSSSAILECVALLAILGAVGALGGGIFMSIGMKSVQPLIAGLGATLILLYLAGTALNSEVVNVKVAGDASAGEEAIGIYAFLLKVHLRLVPFVYGVSLLGLALLLIYTSVTLPFKDFASSIFLIQPGTQIMFIALMPFGIYVAVLFLYLTIDVIRAILVIPGKLDKLK